MLSSRRDQFHPAGRIVDHVDVARFLGPFEGELTIIGSATFGLPESCIFRIGSPVGQRVGGSSSSILRLRCAIAFLNYPVDHRERDVGDIFFVYEPSDLILVIRKPGLGVRHQAGGVRRSSFQLLEPSNKISHARRASGRTSSFGPFKNARARSIMCAPPGSIRTDASGDKLYFWHPVSNEGAHKQIECIVVMAW